MSRFDVRRSRIQREGVLQQRTIQQKQQTLKILTEDLPKTIVNMTDIIGTQQAKDWMDAANSEFNKAVANGEMSYKEDGVTPLSPDELMAARENWFNKYIEANPMPGNPLASQKINTALEESKNQWDSNIAEASLRMFEEDIVKRRNTHLNSLSDGEYHDPTATMNSLGITADNLSPEALEYYNLSMSNEPDQKYSPILASQLFSAQLEFEMAGFPSSAAKAKVEREYQTAFADNIAIKNITSSWEDFVKVNGGTTNDFINTQLESYISNLDTKDGYLMPLNDSKRASIRERALAEIDILDKNYSEEIKTRWNQIAFPQIFEIESSGNWLTSDNLIPILEQANIPLNDIDRLGAETSTLIRSTIRNNDVSKIAMNMIPELNTIYGSNLSDQEKRTQAWDYIISSTSDPYVITKILSIGSGAPSSGFYTNKPVWQIARENYKTFSVQPEDDVNLTVDTPITSLPDTTPISSETSIATSSETTTATPEESISISDSTPIAVSAPAAAANPLPTGIPSYYNNLDSRTLAANIIVEMQNQDMPLAVVSLANDIQLRAMFIESLSEEERQEYMSDWIHYEETGEVTEKGLQTIEIGGNFVRFGSVEAENAFSKYKDGIKSKVWNDYMTYGNETLEDGKTTMSSLVADRDKNYQAELESMQKGYFVVGENNPERQKLADQNEADMFDLIASADPEDFDTIYATFLERDSQLYFTPEGEKRIREFFNPASQFSELDKFRSYGLADLMKQATGLEPGDRYYNEILYNSVLKYKKEIIDNINPTQTINSLATTMSDLYGDMVIQEYATALSELDELSSISPKKLIDEGTLISQDNALDAAGRFINGELNPIIQEDIELSFSGIQDINGQVTTIPSVGQTATLQSLMFSIANGDMDDKQVATALLAIALEAPFDPNKPVENEWARLTSSFDSIGNDYLQSAILGKVEALYGLSLIQKELYENWNIPVDRYANGGTSLISGNAELKPIIRNGTMTGLMAREIGTDSWVDVSILSPSASDSFCREIYKDARRTLSERVVTGNKMVSREEVVDYLNETSQTNPEITEYMNLLSLVNNGKKFKMVPTRWYEAASVKFVPVE